MHTSQVTHGDLGVFTLIAKALTPQPADSAARRRADDVPGARLVETESRPKGFFERMDQWFWTRRQRALEAYLGQASDMHELEVRIREVERATPYRFY